MVEAVIFDMDGIIIDSEPYWKEAEEKVYNSLGLNITQEMCVETTGLGTHEAVSYWYRIMPWQGKTIKEVCSEIEAEVRRIVIERGEPIPGVVELILNLKSKGIRIGLASSSPKHLIDTVLDKLNLRHYFEVAHSAEFEIAGKPHPAVYLGAARIMGVKPSNCLAIEDSITGMKAGLAAGMFVAVMPIPIFEHREEYTHAQIRLKNFTEFPIEQLAMMDKKDVVVF